MPLFENGEALIRQNLNDISAGNKVRAQVVGAFTDEQFRAINAYRLLICMSY